MSQSKTSSSLSAFTAGFIRQNPTFSQVLGLCPTLATSTNAENALGMGLATMGVLVLSNIFISALRKLIPNEVRIPAYISVIASFVTIVNLLMHGYTYQLWTNLGLYIPLIVVNCIIMGRAEAFASKNGIWKSFLDGVGMGLGFIGAILLLGITRELLSVGSVFGVSVWPKTYGMFVLMLPPGAFLVIGLYMALFKHISNVRKKALKKSKG